MEIIVERASCKLRMVSCESWIGVENGWPNLILLKALWSTWGAVVEPRGGLWKHLGIIFGNLCATLGVQAGLGRIFSKFSEILAPKMAVKIAPERQKNMTTLLSSISIDF